MANNVIKHLKAHFPIIIFSVLYLFFTFATYKNYGITADEERRYNMGKLLADRFFHAQNIPATTFYDHYPFYGMVLTLLNPSGYYEKYHFLNMLFATLIFIFSYAVLYVKFKNDSPTPTKSKVLSRFWQAKYLALLGPIILVFTPRFFGDIPANPKDMPFAVLYFCLLSLAYILNLKKVKTLYKIIILGIIMGFTQSLRTIGFNLYIIYAIYLLVLNFKNSSKQKNPFLNFLQFIKPIALELAGIFLLAGLIMLTTWPYLGENPANFLGILKISQDFPYWDRTILYMGKALNKDEIPWHYLFVWLCISTPIYTLLLTLGSFVYFIKNKTNTLLNLLLLGLLTNFAFYLILKPVTYNGVRHFLYLLPIMAILSVITLVELLKKYNKVIFIYVACLVITLVQMLKLHPYEYLYFNLITRNLCKVEKTFETDYWGATYKDATKMVLTYIKANNLKNQIVYACNVPYAVRYYSEYQFDLTNKIGEANIIICDFEKDYKRSYSQDLVGTFVKDGIRLNVIRRVTLNLY